MQTNIKDQKLFFCTISHISQTEKEKKNAKSTLICARFRDTVKKDRKKVGNLGTSFEIVVGNRKQPIQTKEEDRRQLEDSREIVAEKKGDVIWEQ